MNGARFGGSVFSLVTGCCHRRAGPAVPVAQGSRALECPAAGFIRLLVATLTPATATRARTREGGLVGAFVAFGTKGSTGGDSGECVLRGNPGSDRRAMGAWWWRALSGQASWGKEPRLIGADAPELFSLHWWRSQSTILRTSSPRSEGTPNQWSDQG